MFHLRSVTTCTRASDCKRYSTRLRPKHVNLTYTFHFLDLSVPNTLRDIRRHRKQEKDDADAYEGTAAKASPAGTCISKNAISYLQPKMLYKNHAQNAICRGIYNADQRVSA